MEITILELVQRPESIEVVFTIIERLKNAKDLYSEVRNYKKEKFYKRVLCFLREIESVSESDRINFIKELKANPEDFWKNLLIKLEEMDEERKAKITGALCQALILKFIDVPTFARLTNIIEKIYIDDLVFFGETYKHMPTTQELLDDIYLPLQNQESIGSIIDQLVNHGLLTDNRIVEMQHGSDSKEIIHKPTVLGKQLLAYGF